MNDNEQMEEYTVALSPWINEYRTPGPIVTEKPATPSTASNSAEIYRKCQEEVLARWSKSVDRLGRSLQWKVDAAREDIANHRTDGSIMEALAKETIALAEKYL